MLIESLAGLVLVRRCTGALRFGDAVSEPLRALVTGGNADFLIDWAADPTFGQDADVGDITKYPDGTHPSQANQNNMEALYYRPSLNAL